MGKELKSNNAYYVQPVSHEMIQLLYLDTDMQSKSYVSI